MVIPADTIPRRRPSGFTLIELVVSSIIVTIILMGIMTANYALRKMESEGTRDNSLTMQTNAVAEHIRLNAARATGMATDIGIRGNRLAQNNNSNYLCIRQDVTPFTPAIFTDDTWTCYTLLRPGGGGAATRTLIYTCTLASEGSCTAADHLLGTAVSDTFSSVQLPDATHHYFQFTITNRTDPTAAQNVNTNPEVSVTYRVVPEGQSF